MATTLQLKSRLCALYPTPYQGQKSPTGHQPIFYPRFHQGLPITANKFHCTKKSFLITHRSTGRVLCRRHFNASRDYALFTPHHIRAKSRLLAISPYFTHVPTKGPSSQPTSFLATKNLFFLTIAQTDVFY